MGTKIRTGLINFSLPTIPTTRWRWKFEEWKWKHFTHSLDWRSFLDFKHCFNGNDTKDHSYCNYSNFVQHICSKLRNSSFFSLSTPNSQMSKSRVSSFWLVWRKGRKCGNCVESVAHFNFSFPTIPAPFQGSLQEIGVLILALIGSGATHTHTKCSRRIHLHIFYT